MARTDRLFRLLQAMRMLPQPVTAARLAEETGVSPRSLYRDIDSLRAAGARIEGERGYGYRLIEDYTLPPQSFDRMEIEAIVLGLAEVRHSGDPALAKAAASVLAKVAATLPDDHERHLFHAVSQAYRLESRYSSAPRIDILRQACWDEAALMISYTDRQGVVTGRKIWPLAIIYLDHKQVVLTWCCLRQGFRKFFADRISQATRCGESYRPRRVALLRTYLAELYAERHPEVTPKEGK
jgi:predicted DNA-binding transcriptional regulator YafY